MKRRPEFKLFISPPIEENNYTFSTKNWTRIWFTTDPESFTPPKNKEKIINFLIKFPSRTISFVYDSRLLNEKGREDFAKFKHDLSNVNVLSQIKFLDCADLSFKEELINETELQLYELANIELQNLVRGGNVAAASDIIRTLSPVYRLGIYTDFDVQFQNLDTDEFKAASTFLCGMNGDARCNDVLAVHPENSQDNDLLNKYHHIMTSAYKLCKEYGPSDLAELQFGMSLKLMSIYESMRRESVDKAINKVFLIAKRREREFHSLPMLFLIRKACEEAIVEEAKDNSGLKTIYKQIYMQTIIYSTGPSAMPSMNYSQERSCKKLSRFVRGQADLFSNDCSWLPPVLISTPHAADSSQEDLEAVEPADPQNIPRP